MRFLLAIILIAVLAGAAEYFLPWWTLAVVAFAVSMPMRMKGWMAFLAGFLGIGLMWLSVMLYRDGANEHILSMRMAPVIKVGSYQVLIVIVAILGGLIGGLAAWAGALIIPRR